MRVATATVTNGASPVTVGQVQFKVDGANVGSPVAVNASGVATLTTTAIPLGPQSITATYSGSSNYLTSTSNTVSILIYGYPTGGGTGLIGTAVVAELLGHGHALGRDGTPHRQVADDALALAQRRHGAHLDGQRDGFEAHRRHVAARKLRALYAGRRGMVFSWAFWLCSHGTAARHRQTLDGIRPELKPCGVDLMPPD